MLIKRVNDEHWQKNRLMISIQKHEKKMPKKREKKEKQNRRRSPRLEKQNRRRSPRFKSQQGGWDSNKASNMYQKMLMELKQYINDYTKGLYTQG